MESNPENIAKQILAEKKITDILSEGLHLFVKNYGKIIIPFIIFLALSNFLIVLLTSQFEWYIKGISTNIDAILTKLEQDFNAVTDQDITILMQYLVIVTLYGFLQGLIGAFFTTLSMILISSYLYKKYTKNEDCNDTILNKKLFFGLLIIGCGVPFGFFILLFIPGILIFCYFIFTLFTYNLKGVDKPVQEARLIAKGSFLKIIIVFLFCVVITSLITSIYQNILNIIWPVDSLYDSWLNPSNRNYLLLFLYNLATDVTGILLAPLFISVLTVLFATLKARKDLGLNEVSSYRQYGRQSRIIQKIEDYSQDITREDVYTGMFCPFCGDKIGTLKKFCPNCGESLKGLKL